MWWKTSPPHLLGFFFEPFSIRSIRKLIAGMDNASGYTECLQETYCGSSVEGLSL